MSSNLGQIMGFALGFQPLAGEHADLGTAAGAAAGTVLLVSSDGLLETFMLPWEWSKEPFLKRVEGGFSLGEAFVSSLEST